MHKVISPISSCMCREFSSPQPKGPGVEVKRAMCHIRAGGLLACGSGACLRWRTRSAARAETGRSIEQAFANSLTAVPRGESRRVRRILCAGLFQRLDEPGQAAGGFLGDAERPQRLGDPAAGADANRLFRHRGQDGGELPQVADRAEAVFDHRGLHRRPPTSAAAPAPISWSIGPPPARSPNRRSRR